MYKSYKVKQRISPFAKFLFGDGIQKMSKEAGIDEFSTFPMSYKVVRAVRNQNNEFLTGLTKEEETRYSPILGVDLSKHSEYWKTAVATLSAPNAEITFNEANARDMVLMKMAIASGHLAPNKTDLHEKLIYRDVNFYILDEEEEQTRKQRKNNLEDEATIAIAAIRNQKDKLLTLCYALNLPCNEAFSVEDVYDTLKSYKNSIVESLEKLENLNEVLKSDPVKLQASYYFNRSINKTIQYDSVAEMYTFEGNALGSTKVKAVERLIDPENKALLNAIIKAYKTKVSKK